MNNTNEKRRNARVVSIDGTAMDRYRARLGLTDRQLADKLVHGRGRIGERTIESARAGNQIKIRTAQLLADKLEVKLWQITKDDKTGIAPGEDALKKKRVRFRCGIDVPAAMMELFRKEKSAFKFYVLLHLGDLLKDGALDIEPEFGSIFFSATLTKADAARISKAFLVGKLVQLGVTSINVEAVRTSGVQTETRKAGEGTERVLSASSEAVSLTSTADVQSLVQKGSDPLSNDDNTESRNPFLIDSTLPSTPTANQCYSFTRLLERNGRYKLLEELSRDGLNALYKAHDNILQMDIAIRTIGATNIDAEDLSRFINELIKVSAYQEQSSLSLMPAIFERHFQDHIVWISRKFMANSLFCYLKDNGPMAWSHAQHFVFRILKCLAAGHRYGIVHGNIKPTNVLFNNENSQLSLSDWMILPSRDLAACVAAYHLSGTLPYLAPECWGSNAHFGSQSDCYAVGVLLFESLTGYNPFGNPAFPTLLSMKCIDWARLLDTTPNLADDARHIIGRATAQDLALRYKDADAFIEEIKVPKGSSPRA